MVRQLRSAVMGDSGSKAMADAYGALSAALWDVRDRLDTLLYRLTSEALVVAAGATRWLNRADDDVRHSVEALRVSELARAVETEALARLSGAPPEATLRELAAAAPEPWSTVLGEHRGALRALTAELRTVAAEDRRLLEAGARAIRETLDRIGTTLGAVDAAGTFTSRPRGARHG